MVSIIRSPRSVHSFYMPSQTAYIEMKHTECIHSLHPTHDLLNHGLSKVHPITCRNRGTGVEAYLTLSLTSALGEGGWSAPYPGRFTPRNSPCNHCTGDWVGLGAGQDGGRKSRPHRHSNHKPSGPLYQLCYPGRLFITDMVTYYLVHTLSIINNKLFVM